MYTFDVYMASAIYTSAEGMVMEKFGVGQSKASLGLSMYVLGYGIGPMVSSFCLPPTLFVFTRLLLTVYSFTALLSSLRTTHHR